MKSKYVAVSFAMAALVGNGVGMLVTNAGEIQTAQSYGKAKIFGISAEAGLDIVLGSHFAVRLVGQFTLAQ